MGNFIDDLKRTFKQGNIVVRLIFINVAAYVLVTFIGVLLSLFGMRVGALASSMDPHHLYVPAFGRVASVGQHVVALLVW